MKHILLLLLAIPSILLAQPLLVGHRGSIWGTESSIESFTNGAKAGYYALETDVKVSRDGRFVLVHDDDLKRFGYPDVKIAETDWVDLSQLVLRQTRGGHAVAGQLCLLEDYLDICNQYGCVPVIELKWMDGINSNDQSRLPQLLAIVAEKGLKDKAIILTSMRPCLEFIRQQPEYADMHLQWLCRPNNEAEHFEWCKTWHMDVNMMNGFTVETVQKYHEAGLLFNCWTINNPQDYDILSAMGVDMLTTDSIIRPVK